MDIYSDTYIASFDIGDVNFSVYIEKCDTQQLIDLQTTRELDIPSRIDKACMIGERVYTEVINLRECTKEDKKKQKSYHTLSTRKNIIEYLNSLRFILNKCDYVIVEQQYMNLGQPRGIRKSHIEANFKAIKISEDVLMWFLISFPQKHVELYSSHNKTRVLGAPAYVKSKNDRKKWCVEFTERMYKNREDSGMKEFYDICFKEKGRQKSQKRFEKYISSLKTKDKDVQILVELFLYNRQKLDDISDSFCQCQAFKIAKLVM